jgi:formylglycine-generating enzyme required for sulfatase activity
LVAGHNDNGPALALQASTDDSQGCYGTVTKDVDPTCGNGATQRRTHYLSNGEVIWDLAGNVWEWTDDVVRGPNKPVGGGISWVDWPSVSDYGVLSYDVLKPSDSSWDLNKRVGRYFQGGSSNTDYAFLRGANKDHGSRAGVFTLYLDYTPGDTGNHLIGFRCAVSP